MNKRPLLIHISAQEKVLFFKHLSLYLKAGISLPLALSYIQESATKKNSLYVYSHISEVILSGKNLSTALSSFPKIYKSFCIGFIKAGEESGSLPNTLFYLSELLKKNKLLSQKIQSALLYPFLVLLSTIFLTAFLTFYIFPKIIPVLKGLKTSLPFPTKVLIDINTIGTHGWTIIVVCILALLCIGTVFIRNKNFLYVLESLYIRTPVLGTVYKYYALSSFITTISIQLQGGIRLPIAINLAGESISGALYPNALKIIEQELYSGKRFSEAVLLHPTLFPRLISQMISTGESTGTLTECTSTLARTYEDSLDELVKNLTVLIEPVLMICMGIVVGFVALAIILPIYKVTQNLSM